MLSSPAEASPPIYDSARRPSPFAEEAMELLRYRDLVVAWSTRTIKLRYKRSALGVLWTLLEPLMLMVILSIVFSTAFRFPIENYALYLLAGLLLFDFLSRSTLQMVSEVIASESLAKRIYVPRSAFAVASALTYLVNWLIALVPLAGIMLYFDRPFTWSLLTVPAGMLLAALFALGIGLLVATLGAFFHDVHLSYQVLLTAWFYATPIIWPLEIVEDPSVLAAVRLNPLFHLVELVRSPVYDGHAAAGETWLLAAAVSLGAAGLGWWVFTHWRNAIAARS